MPRYNNRRQRTEKFGLGLAMRICIGLEVLDKFVLVTKQRLISGKVKKQQHARKYDSYFYVLKKNSKKNIRYFDFMEEKELNDFIDGLKNNWLSKKNKETIVKTPPVNADE
jgi:hypothetical protein